MIDRGDTFVQKSCVYATRADGAVLVFEGPSHETLQVPKGTVDPGETAREAAFRELAEESGVGAVSDIRQLASDCWHRRATADGDRWYVRHFFQVTIHEPRERWDHEVTGSGAEVGETFSFRWLQPERAADQRFALDLDDYLHLLPGTRTGAGEAPLDAPTPGTEAAPGHAD
ncbi:NUDIX domain-containing protein [Haloglomus litoreum]|uniref:NUDIX domain-containing protein n=1 Tax=Haloglomus litoreum TaxID=3034026 RepID=UPI0023E86593|nr:NUDIX domain-containing protein [Haloglomus sp. DT116]